MNLINRARILRNEAGVAVTEFALVLPVLLTLFYGVIEVTRFVLVTQKVEKLAHTAADVVAQSSVVTNAGLGQLLIAGNDIMKPFDFADSGVVLVSSLYRAQGAGNAIINWRYQGGGSLVATSTFGNVGDVPAMPSGFTFDERENVIAVEVFYEFTPLISSHFFESALVYRYAFYRPRFGNLTVAPV